MSLKKFLHYINSKLFELMEENRSYRRWYDVVNAQQKELTDLRVENKILKEKLEKYEHIYKNF